MKRKKKKKKLQIRTLQSIEGTMKKEAEIVLNRFNIKLNYTNKIEDDDQIILVDTNYLSEISKEIKKI